MARATTKRKKAPIGRKPKRSKIPSLIDNNIINYETVSTSNSTKDHKKTLTEDISTDKPFFDKEPTKSSKTNKRRKVGIGRIHKKSSQANASTQQKSAASKDIFGYRAG